MMTGDATINRDAPIICCTAEILANMALRDGATRADVRRHGRVSLLRRPRARHGLAGAAARARRDDVPAHVGHAGRHAGHHREACRRRPDARSRWCAGASDRCRSNSSIAKRRSTRRSTSWSRAGRAPIYLVNFTQRGAAEEAQNLMSVDVSTKADKDAIQRGAGRSARSTRPTARTSSASCATASASTTRACCREYRLLVERLAQKGLLKVISGTDTLGVGVNVPIRTVLFTQLCKFDGEKTGILGVREFQQIAGRAGRKGFDDRGYVVAQAPAHVIENQRLARKQAQPERRS